MTIEQRARQQLAEAETAYQHHYETALRCDGDERKQHLAAAGDCMIAVDVLRDVLREPEQQNGSASQDYASSSQSSESNGQDLDPQSQQKAGGPRFPASEFCDYFIGRFSHTEDFYVGRPQHGTGCVIWRVTENGCTLADENTILGVLASGVPPLTWQRFAAALDTAKRRGQWPEHESNGHAAPSPCHVCNVAPVRVTVSLPEPATFDDVLAIVRAGLDHAKYTLGPTLERNIAIGAARHMGVAIPEAARAQHPEGFCKDENCCSIKPVPGFGKQRACIAAAVSFAFGKLGEKRTAAETRGMAEHIADYLDLNDSPFRVPVNQ